MSLGYDPSARTYKLVQLLVLDGKNQLAAAIYDLGGGWRSCLVPPELFISEDGLPDDRDGRDAGICTSGTLNWISHGSRRRGRIVVFDLSREEFREVRSPVNLRDFNAHVELVDVGGSLALLDFSKGFYVRMWVLGESGWIRKPRILIGPWPRASTDYILGVYYYEESLVFWEYRHKLVQQKKKRKRGKKFKIEIKSEEELYFINVSDSNDLFLDKLPGALHKFCGRLNFARLVSG